MAPLITQVITQCSFNSTWLRHQCQCDQCLQPHSGQWLQSADRMPAAFATLDAHLDTSSELHNIIEFQP